VREQAAVESASLHRMQERAAKLRNKDVHEVAQSHGRTPGHMWRLICTSVESGNLLLLANLVSMPAQEVREAFADGTCTQEEQQVRMARVGRRYIASRQQNSVQGPGLTKVAVECSWQVPSAT
jgi:hypothetical protein